MKQEITVGSLVLSVEVPDGLPPAYLEFTFHPETEEQLRDLVQRLGGLPRGVVRTTRVVTWYAPRVRIVMFIPEALMDAPRPVGPIERLLAEQESEADPEGATREALMRR